MVFPLLCSLNEQSLKIHLDKFGRGPSSYTIILLGWREDEVSFKDCYGVKDIPTISAGVARKLSYRKLLGACNKALLENHCEYVWIGTCYISQTCGAKLSEAINFMYQWYGKDQKCYLYLGR